MLMELSVVEQRYLAVREALDSGATITDIARRYGVDRRTVHRWLVRYAAGGLGALAGCGRTPSRTCSGWLTGSPPQMTPRSSVRCSLCRVRPPSQQLVTSLARRGPRSG
jgi:transposase-like protein